MNIRKTPELIEKAQSLRDMGLSNRKIGIELGVSPSTIDRLFNQKSYERNLEAGKKWYNSNKERKTESVTKWRESNADRHRENNRKRYHKDPEKYRSRFREWQKDNLDKFRELNSKYRARKRNASVPLTSLEQSQMRSLYENCPDGYEVDHIIPLTKGGLHHPLNLQCLPALENRTKKNNIRQEDIELFRYRLIHETTDTDVMTIVKLMESLPQ